MIFTEEEAKNKRCQEGFSSGSYTVPRQIQFGPTDLGWNTITVQPAPYHCIGSACMAWRWSSPLYADDPERKLSHGYCGKAGKP